MVTKTMEIPLCQSLVCPRLASWTSACVGSSPRHPSFALVEHPLPARRAGVAVGPVAGFARQDPVRDRLQSASGPRRGVREWQAVPIIEPPGAAPALA